MTCEVCKLLELEAINFRVKKKQVWRVKTKEYPKLRSNNILDNKIGAKVINIDPNGFQKALKPIKVRVSQVKAANITNNFQLLEAEETLDVVEGGHMYDKGKGGAFQQ